MKRLLDTSIAIALTGLMAIACNSKKEAQVIEEMKEATEVSGDETIYGLACEGCNDTIVVFLRSPYTGTDPDTLNVLEASRQHRVLGVPRIGDKLAIIANPDDPTMADIVIVTEDLQAEWCYKVMPTLRQRADRDDAARLPDSIKALLSVEREYGLHIKTDGAAMPIGMNYRAKTSDEESPVEYPELKRYFEWHIFNGQMVLQLSRTDSLGERHLLLSDTADIAMLTADTLVLRFKDYEQGYYKRAAEEKE